MAKVEDEDDGASSDSSKSWTEYQEYKTREEKRKEKSSQSAAADMEEDTRGSYATKHDFEVNLVNQLSASRSPYVRGHMKNPVAWQMWNHESLTLAKKSNRLIFLSIGYAACHWCHVMERESFDNPQVAKLLNLSFIPIKVDREERPDVDRIYMNYVQATSGSGGWPLNVFITPNLEPIFGGTYWPGPGANSDKTSGGTNFLDILHKIVSLWQNDRQRCLESAKMITKQLQEYAQEGSVCDPEYGDVLELELLEEAYNHFRRKYDRRFSGFGLAPKFPTPVNLDFLLRLGEYSNVVRHIVGETECNDAKEMALATLRTMYRSGLHDHIGNGFHRYSVTRDWSLPHFEKMLYDQALLMHAYVTAYLITKDKEMLEAIHDIATYITTPPIRAPSGGFFSSEDADSRYRAGDTDKREGAFYVWTLKELHAVLGDEDSDILARYYHVLENGNVSPIDDPHDELLAQNVLTRIETTPNVLARELGLSLKHVLDVIKSGKEKLRQHRDQTRSRPELDDKIVVAWNGLAIGALARASIVLEQSDPRSSAKYRDAATQAAQFIFDELYDKLEWTLKRVYRKGPGDVRAFADDYAFMIAGLLDLYEATFNDEWLRFADELQQTQRTIFWDYKRHGFYSTAPNQNDVLLQLKDGMDGAEPSTNGVSASNLYRLASLLADSKYANVAKATTSAFEPEASQHPFLFPSLLGAVVAGHLGTRSYVVIGSTEKVDSIRGWAGMKGTVVRLIGGILAAGGRGLRRQFAGQDGSTLMDIFVKERNEVLALLDATGGDRVMVCKGKTCMLLGEGTGLEANEEKEQEDQNDPRVNGGKGFMIT